MTRHYHLQASMTGYLAENPADTYTTKRALMVALANERDEYRDAGYLVRGSLASGYEYGWPADEGSSRVSIGGFFGVIEWWACADNPCEITDDEDA
jgi:hypothetical protein